MKEKGLLLVISGFSGAGKGTVVKRLLELHNDYALSISATTRSPREGEQNGREYFFKSTEEFESMIDNSELIEYAKYVSNYYGTPKAYVEEQLEAGKNVILEIEIQGALNIKKMYPDAVLLFIIVFHSCIGTAPTFFCTFTVNYTLLLIIYITSHNFYVTSQHQKAVTYKMQQPVNSIINITNDNIMQ